jgi:hypothetical protein
LPGALSGTWVRTSRLQTYDYQPNAWVQESNIPASQKTLVLKKDFSFQSNQIDCSDCRMAYRVDTLYLLHSKGMYKFRVMSLTDSTLQLQTNVGVPQYSLPNTGLFDFVLEEQYKKVK